MSIIRTAILFDAYGRVITPGVHANGSFTDMNGNVSCVRSDNEYDTGDNNLYFLGDGSGYMYGVGEIR
jgi:hypothetical protein